MSATHASLAELDRAHARIESLLAARGHVDPAALERVLLCEGLAEPRSLASRRRSWQVAAERTPHDESIRLPRRALERVGLGDPQR